MASPNSSGDGMRSPFAGGSSGKPADYVQDPSGNSSGRGTTGEVLRQMEGQFPQRAASDANMGVDPASKIEKDGGELPLDVHQKSTALPDGNGAGSIGNNRKPFKLRG